jgi:predicted esterase
MMNFASLVNLYSQRMPGSTVARLASTLGPEGAARILQNLSGELLYVPRRSSLFRFAMPYIVKAEMKGLRPKTSEFRKKVEFLASAYGLDRQKIRSYLKKG